MTYCISSQILIFVKSSTFLKNMMSWFDRIQTIWILKLFPWEKPQLIFTNRSMIYYSSHHSYTQRVRMPKMLEPWPPIYIGGFDRIVVVINKIEKLASPQIWSLKSHLPIFMMLLHSFFLLKSQDDLQENKGIWQDCLVSLSIVLWSNQLQWLRHSQNLIKLLILRRKNFLSLFEMDMVCI